MSWESKFDLPCWYAIQTKPQQEDRAESNLIAWGVETFYPKMQVRRFNQFTGKPSSIAKPLFTRYIFARFQASTMLHDICFTRGVQTVVKSDGICCPVDDNIIETIKLRVGQNGFVRLGEEFKRGDKVVISSGPLKDLIGVFNEAANDHARVSILLTSISYQSRVVIQRELLKKAS
jgi:transcriptional antiterminator RfaH